MGQTLTEESLVTNVMSKNACKGPPENQLLAEEAFLLK